MKQQTTKRETRFDNVLKQPPSGKFFEVRKGTNGLQIILAFSADVLAVLSRVPSPGLRDKPKKRLRWRLKLFEINY